MRILVVVAACLALMAAPATVSAVTPQPVSVLVLKATWGPTPFTDSDVQSAVDGAAQFLDTASFGQVQITGAQTPWLHAYQAEIPCPTAPSSQLYTGANAAAAAAGYDVASYDRVVYLLPADSACLISGAGFGDPITRTVTLFGSLWAGIVAHELGHTFAMGHAGAVICGDPKKPCARDPYGSPWDLMGHGGATQMPIGDPGALQKASAGWLTSYRQVSVPGTYTLDALELPSTLPQALIVRVAGRELWIDHREAIGNDAYLKTSIWHKLTQGIAVHEAAIDAVQTHLSHLNLSPEYLLANDGHGSWIAGSKPFRIPNVLEIDIVRHVGTTLRVRLRWLDHSPPSAPELSAPTDSTLTWKMPRDAGTGISGYRASIDNGPTQTLTQPTLDLSTFASGDHIVRVTAIDYAGNTSKTTTLRFTR